MIPTDEYGRRLTFGQPDLGSKAELDQLLEEGKERRRTNDAIADDRPPPIPVRVKLTTGQEYRPT